MSYAVPLSPRQMPGENVNRSKHPGPPGNKSGRSKSKQGHAPPVKRPRSQDVCTPDSADSRRRESQINPRIYKQSKNVFYKTRVCEKFVVGNCSKGEKCNFAHGSEDLHEPPQNWKEQFYANSRRGRSKRGMKLCKSSIFEQECPYGENCKFLHQVPCNTEVARSLPINESSPSTQTTGPMLGQTRLNKHSTCSDVLVVNRKQASFKTKMCTKWEITGQCPLKERCHFAHGHSELQVPGSPNKAETVTDIHSFPKKAVPQLSNDALPTTAVATQERVIDQVLPKWKMPKKITSIYGDWPEGFIPPEKLRH